MATDDDGVEEICQEFGVSPQFVAFVWATLETMGKDILPIGSFRPRTKRECALAVAIAMRSKAGRSHSVPKTQ